LHGPSARERTASICAGPMSRESDHLISHSLASVCSHASTSSTTHTTVSPQILISQPTQRSKTAAPPQTVRLNLSPPSSSSFQIGLCSSSPRRSGVQMLLPVARHRDSIPSSPTGHANVGIAWIQPNMHS
jgi:hypothetical protein